VFRFYRGISMAGTFRDGDCLSIEPVSMEQVRTGDIVAFHNFTKNREKEDVVHRVVKISPGVLITRGDYCRRHFTGVVTPDRLIGKVIYLERNGTFVRVDGGYRGFMRGEILQFIRFLSHVLGSTLGWVYRLLRRSGMVSRIWEPHITTVLIASKAGPFVKYIAGNRTVARWWPLEDRLECRKPFDLIIKSP